MTTTIRSISPVQTSRGWAVRVRSTDGGERYMTAAAGYTMAQAGLAADGIRRDIAHHGDAARDADLGPLPAGVTLRRHVR